MISGKNIDFLLFSQFPLSWPSAVKGLYPRFSKALAATHYKSSKLKMLKFKFNKEIKYKKLWPEGKRHRYTYGGFMLMFDRKTIKFLSNYLY